MARCEISRLFSFLYSLAAAASVDAAAVTIEEKPRVQDGACDTTVWRFYIYMLHTSCLVAEALQPDAF